jgi:sulfotransferase family protein
MDKGNMDDEYHSVMKEFIENGVFVYGPRKSGTTLVQNLLDGSNSIMMVPDELKLKFMVPKILESNREKKAFYFKEGRSSFRNNLEITEDGGKYNVGIKGPFRYGNMSKKDLDGKFDLERYVKGLNRIANDPEIRRLKDIYSHDIIEFRESLREGGKYRYWASKEVGGDPELIVTHFKSIFPESKCIFIARDPKMVVRSIILKRRRRGVILSMKRIFTECHKAQKIISYYATVEGYSDKILVFYEDLTRDTNQEMKRIARFLQIPYEGIFEIPSLFGMSVKVRTSSRNTRSVFPEKTNWKKALKFREKCAVMISSFSYALFRRMVGTQLVTYQKLREMTDHSSGNGCARRVRI